MICVNVKKITALEAIRNLSEMVDSIGQEHARQVMENIVLRELERLDDPDFDADGSIKVLELAFDRIAQFLPESDMPSAKELEEAKAEIELIKKDLKGDLSKKDDKLKD